MAGLFSILTSLDRRETDRGQALDAIQGLGAKKVAAHLSAAGLDIRKLPKSLSTQAAMLLALHKPAIERLDEPKTTAGLVAGKIYSTDDSNLVGRFVVPKADGGADILGLYKQEDGARLTTDFSLSPAEASADDVPPEDETAESEDQPQISNVPTTIEVSNPTHIQVDIKLVLWIPYHGNSFPLPTRYLPKQTDWEIGCRDESQRLALRAMLATGNPTPPDSFPKQSDWSAFVASKEYRGYTWADLYVCCPDETCASARMRDSDAGYTPPSSEIPEDPAATFAKRLTDYHADHQNIGSVATGLVQTPAGAAIDASKAKAAVPDQYRDAVILIKELCLPTDESYSQGEKIGPTRTDSKECLSGNWEFYVRVGKAHNLLNYALCGKLIKFQGGTLRYKLCCDGTLSLSYSHSAIPSWRLYVNNQKVGEYDMLSAPWTDIEQCFYAPPSTLGTWSTNDLRNALNEQIKSPDVANVWSKDMKFTPKDGCEGAPSDDWIYDSA